MPSAIFSNLESLSARQVDAGPRVGADVGEPLTRFAELFTAQGTEVGVWSCTPGGWSILDRPDTEIVLILSGSALITGENGTATKVAEGDLFVLPKGWSGRWDIIEDVKKLYVIVEEETS